MKTFSLEIVTPIKVIIEESVKYLRCPGVDGSFGVMHKHRNGVFALDTGEVKSIDRVSGDVVIGTVSVARLLEINELLINSEFFKIKKEVIN